MCFLVFFTFIGQRLKPLLTPEPYHSEIGTMSHSGDAVDLLLLRSTVVVLSS